MQQMEDPSSAEIIFYWKQKQQQQQKATINSLMSTFYQACIFFKADTSVITAFVELGLRQDYATFY